MVAVIVIMLIMLAMVMRMFVIMRMAVRAVSAMPVARFLRLGRNEKPSARQAGSISMRRQLALRYRAKRERSDRLLHGCPMLGKRIEHSRGKHIS